MKKNSYKPLYMAWGFLYVLTAVLGLLFPEAEGTTVRLVLLLIAVMFFLPPALILERRRRPGTGSTSGSSAGSAWPPSA